jgi:hypothetical protein
MVILRSCSTNCLNGDAAAKLKKLYRACLRLIMEASRNNWNQGVYPKNGFDPPGKFELRKTRRGIDWRRAFPVYEQMGGRGRAFPHHRVGINRKTLFVPKERCILAVVEPRWNHRKCADKITRACG